MHALSIFHTTLSLKGALFN